jgi:hypothetical protein
LQLTQLPCFCDLLSNAVPKWVIVWREANGTAHTCGLLVRDARKRKLARAGI